MKFLWLKRLTPRSLFGRTAMILLVPILTIQLVVSYVFIQRLYESVTEQMTRSMVPSVRLVLSGIDAAADRSAAAAVVGNVARALEIDVDFEGTPVAADARVFYDVSGRVVMRELREGIGGITAIDLGHPTNVVQLAVRTRHGPVEMSFSRRRVSASNPHQLLVLMVFVSAVVTLISFLFLRNQIRPIRRLAHVAAAFGMGRVEPYSPSGATEVRQAGRAFLQMRNRIERHIEQRTLMLSGVSHDLRTPLTRMKLALSMMEDNPEVGELRRDVDEMQRMLDTFLGFARLDATETPEPVSPCTLAERAAARAREAGGEIELVCTATEAVPLRPIAVERALDNLMGNAMRYADQARLTVEATDDGVRFTVEDDGPGIPADAREEAMKPFSRLDPARNQDLGGSVGLGLAIVRDIARQHGGSLTLGDSAELGGLRADLVLAR